MITRILYFFVPLVLLTLACSISTPGKDIPKTPTPNPADAPGLTQAVSGTLEATPTVTPEPTVTTTPTVTVTPTPVIVCPKAPKTRFNKVGDRGQVTDTKGVITTRLRRSPEVIDTNIVKLLADKTTFTIIGGPVCTEVKDTGQAFVFWQVSIDNDPLKGWIAEGDAKAYFIEPIP